MTEFNYKKFVFDLWAMIILLRDNKMSADEILYNVIHDLAGVINQEECFSPRCTDYWKSELP